MMKYLFLIALVGVSTVRAADFPFEYAQRRPDASPQKPQAAEQDVDVILPEEYARGSRSIQPKESLAGDLPFNYFRASRSLQPEELEGEGPFEYFRAPRSHQSEELEGEVPFEYFRAPRSHQSEELEGEGPFEYYQPEELEGEGSFGEGSLQPEGFGEGPFHATVEDEAEEDLNRPDVHGLSRARRSLQGGAPQFPVPGSKSSGNAGADISRQGPNTHATINAQHGNDRYEVGGQWSKVIRGPNKAKPEWNVRGAIKW